jgi:molecular chaperone GrpE
MQHPHNPAGNPESRDQAPTEPDANSQAASAETPEDPASRLAAAEALASEHQESFLRAKAETENVRKRASADLQQARKFALESFAAELIPVKDSLEAALAIQQGDVEAYRSGVELTLRQFSSVLEKFHIFEVAPAGERFDPHRHQAISALESDQAPNTVLSVMQKGYVLHERVLRPAFVTVSKPRSGDPA